MKEQVYLLDFIPQSEHAAIRAGTSTYDCIDAFEAAAASITVETDNAQFYDGGPEVLFPYGTCYFSRTIEIKKTMTLTGHGIGGRNAYSSRLLFAPNITGITVNSLTGFEGDMDPPVYPVPGGVKSQGGDATVIRGLKLSSQSLGARNPALNETGSGVGHGIGHGVWCRARANIQQCIIQYFPQHGLYVRAAAVVSDTPEGRAVYGNANNMYVANVACLTNAGCGCYIDGPDTNAGVFIGMDFGSNRLSGLRDSSLIGNTHIGHHTDNNGLDALCSFTPTALSPTTNGRFYCRDVYRANNNAPNWAASIRCEIEQKVRNVGNLYKCVTAGTTAASGGPTGTTGTITDGTAQWNFVAVDANIQIPPDGHAQSRDVWGYIQPNQNPNLHTSYPPWPNLLDDVTPKDYRLGYCYWCDQISATNVLIQPYTEGGQPHSLIIAPTIVVGILIYDAASTGVRLQGSSGSALIGPAIQVPGKLDATNTTDYVTFINGTAGEGLSLKVAGDGNPLAASAASLAWKWDDPNGNWMIQHASNAARIPQRFTTTLNTMTGGRAAAIGAGNTIFQQGIWLGRHPTYIRHLSMAEAQPTSGQWAAGDYVFNATPGGPGAVLGWRCITGGDFAGTPPVFQANRPSTSQQTVVASATNPAFTLTPASSPYHTFYTGTMPGDRIATLSTTGATNGLTFRITRTAAGAFNLNVGTGPLKAMAVNTWADFTYDGTAYYLSASGAL